MAQNSESASYFEWTHFYEEFADKLHAYRDTSEKLVSDLYGIANDNKDLPMANHLKYKGGDGTSIPLKNICPYTTMGIFNRGITDDNRKAIAKILADFLGVETDVPDTFEGIPTLNNFHSMVFFSEDDIPALWEVFSNAIHFSESTDDPVIRNSFIQSYDTASKAQGVSWNLTIGLYWIRPNIFQTLDENSRTYISNTLGISNVHHVNNNAGEYLSLIDSLKNKFQQEDCPVHSFQELSLVAHSGTPPPPPPPPDPIDRILKDGCFLEPTKLSEILDRLKSKQNLILQGPPGTGNTWLAKRLAYALIGRQDADKVRSFQFHPNLSYEDFVRGWRPGSDGKLELVDGPLMEMIETASEDQSSRHVIVIEEINRGNPAQILGEMLTLLEADKRNEDEALELTYRKHKGERVHIPENLYVIGTMNMADRSLAMVDFALRRRFAFVNMEPELKEPWLGWVHEQSGIDRDALLQIKTKLDSLNQTIADDPNLGPQFRIGHSFVTPNDKIDNANDWFRQVVETEIGPLLDEYWYDDREKAQEERSRLLSGI